MRRSLYLLVSMFALCACYSDDAVVTARAQGQVNLAMNTDSDVQVVVRGGNATLTGIASNDAMHARAVQAARAVEGVRGVDDRISTAPQLTGATVPAK